MFGAFKEHRKSILIIFILGFLFFLGRAFEPFINGDSLNHATIAKHIVQSNDWLNLYLNGYPYLKKPPFYFWLIALSFEIFGVSAFAARIPIALFGIFDAILVYLLALELFKNRNTSLLASLFFIVNFHVIRLTSIVRMESVITFFILLNLYLLLKKRYILSGVALGLGILTKGPIAFFGIVSFILYKLFVKEYEFVSGKFFLGLFIAAVVGGWWYVYKLLTDPYFFDVFINKQILHRITGELSEGTVRSQLFYFKRLLSRFLPGLPFFLIGLFLTFKDKLFKKDRLWILVLVYLVVVFIAIDIPKEKFTRYLYYLYPMASLFAAYSVVRLNIEKYVFVGFIVITFGFLAAVMFYPKSFHHPPKEAKACFKICDELKRINGSAIFKGLNQLEMSYLNFSCIRSMMSKPSVVIEKKGNDCVIERLSP
ncbi:ArnT family glycosyltransferase [Hippea alviniae]|uniref:ArnT family glycosyltransferase n=1 Tax=Hippea alviniae TaxID=1279027 RepID=UPI0003B40CAF|nr:glycosyltransferase family 39 protein [Hippea alviniae]